MDREAEAKRLDEMAAKETGLAKAQLLAAAADRLRRASAQKLRWGSLSLPLFRN